MLVAIFACISSFGIETSLQLTVPEVSFAKTGPVKWVAEHNAAPYVFNDNGVISGISADYLELISKRTGIDFTSIDGGTLTDSLMMLRAGKVDMISSIRPTPARSEYSFFSRPYLYVDCVMLQHVTVNSTVGIGRGFAVKTYLQIERKNLQIVEYDDDESAFNAFNNNQVDAVVLDELTAKYLIKKYKSSYRMIRVPYEYPISFAVTKKNLVLLSILDKAISSITEDDRRRILEKWTF